MSIPETPRAVRSETAMKLSNYHGVQMEPSDKRCRWVVRLGILALIAIGVIHMDIIGIDQGTRTLDATTKEKSLGLQSLTLIREMPRYEDYGDTKIEYVPLQSSCKHPAEQFLVHSSVNLCWRVETNNEDRIALSMKNEIVCAPKLMIIGVVGSGTADLAEWFTETKTVKYDTDFRMTHAICAVQQAESSWRLNLRNQIESQYKAMNDYPIFHTLPMMIFETQNLGFTLKKYNRTLRVRSALQHLQVITTEETKFVLILRDPVSRVVSQLFHWNQENTLKDRRNLPLDQEYIHNKVTEQIKKLNECFRTYSPKACIFMTDSKKTSIDKLLLWGMYVEYIEEALKFIRRDQLLVVQQDDYRRHEYDTAHEISQFFDLDMRYRYGMAQYEASKANKRAEGRVTPWKITFNLLKQFYRPFNKRLAILLDDTKWCFSMC